MCNLEVEAKHELEQSATRVRRRRRILVSNCCLTKRRLAQGTSQARHIVRETSDLEVLIVDYVQSFNPELEVLLLTEEHPLYQTHVDSGESGSGKNELAIATLSIVSRLAISETGRCDKWFRHIRRCAGITVTQGGGE